VSTVFIPILTSDFQGCEKSYVCQNELEIGVNYKNTIGCLHTTN